ncbi:hypothetical protein [Desulfotalea psychrophila]|uniref:Uncharacterized protein n=1 Tax=Desulfotalea psychrophila (strain LSv54 / DSM 12343) TaxID=177439 RepID=Q6AIQ3_DESPS|nr:hypothetical protein [Desulfotalea psychrophila]CAG37777.1 unknown protein [Desulfotalea psychrophila LSv54]
MFYAEISVKIHLYRQVEEKITLKLAEYSQQRQCQIVKKKDFPQKNKKKRVQRMLMADFLGGGFGVFNIYRWFFLLRGLEDFKILFLL